MTDHERATLADVIRQHIQLPIPRRLFHYTDATGLIGVLEHRAMWASDVRYLNDSSELEHGLALIGQALQKEHAAATDQGVLGHLLVTCDTVGMLSQGEVFAASFSEVADDLS